MIPISKSLAAGLSLCALCALPLHADGIDPMFTADGAYIDDLEIIGDVTLPNGDVMAAFEMREQHLRLYVDPDAAYVLMDPTNPIIVEQTPFYGFWITTQSVDVADWPRCEYSVSDEYGTPYDAHGTLVWTNLAIAPNGYDLAFGVDLGTCGNRQEQWAYSRAAIEMSPDAGVPHGDIANQDLYTVTDSLGRAYTVEAADGWAVLTSVDVREIVVPMADAAQGTQTVYEPDVLNMYQDCSSGSVHYGYGTWAWANGGFVIDFDTVGFSFPRMDAPPDNGGACRLE